MHMVFGMGCICLLSKQIICRMFSDRNGLRPARIGIFDGTVSVAQKLDQIILQELTHKLWEG